MSFRSIQWSYFIKWLFYASHYQIPLHSMSEWILMAILSREPVVVKLDKSILCTCHFLLKLEFKVDNWNLKEHVWFFELLKQNFFHLTRANSMNWTPALIIFGRLFSNTKSLFISPLSLIQLPAHSVSNNLGIVGDFDNVWFLIHFIYELIKSSSRREEVNHEIFRLAKFC